MKKFFLYTLGVFFALALVIYISLQFFLGSIVKTGVNDFGPKVTQTKVELTGATISPLSGVGTLTGLYVGNPPGWSSDKAFYLGEIHVNLEPFSVMRDHIVINEIIIDQPEFVYETKFVASNIGDLMKNIEQTTGGPKPAESTAKNGKPHKFEVKKFVLRNGHVTVGVGPAAVTISMPPIELTNLGTKESGLTAGQLAAAVMKSVTTDVIQAATQAVLKTVPTLGSAAGSATGDAVKKAGEGIKKLINGGK